MLTTIVSRRWYAAALFALTAPQLSAQDAQIGTRFGGSRSGLGRDIAIAPGGGFYVCGNSYTFSPVHVFDVDEQNNGTPTVTLPGFINNRDEAFLARFDDDGNLSWAALGTGPVARTS